MELKSKNCRRKWEKIESDVSEVDGVTSHESYKKYWHNSNLLARACGSAARAAMEKLNEPGGGKSLSPGDMRKGGALWLCMLPSMSSSCGELKWYFNLWVHSHPVAVIMTIKVSGAPSDQARPTNDAYLSGPFISFTLFECISMTESLLWSLSGLMLLLTSSIGSVLTSSLDRAGGDGVKLSLSVDEPRLPPPLPFVVKLIVSFKLLLLLLGTLLFVLSVLLLLPSLKTKA